MYILTQGAKRFFPYVDGNSISTREVTGEEGNEHEVVLRHGNGLLSCVLGCYKTEKAATDEIRSFVKSIENHDLIHKVLDDYSDTNQNACGAPEE